MKKLWLSLLSGGLLLAGTGCQNTVNRVENADKTMTPNVVSDKRFVTDGFLADRLQLTGTIRRRRRTACCGSRSRRSTCASASSRRCGAA